MTNVFQPLTLRSLTIPNRMWMSPMCTYSAAESGDNVGEPTDFHIAHYSARAAGGAGLVMVEATGVSTEGRISPFDLGLWENSQVEAFKRLADIIRAGGSVPALQLAHAGRKASVNKPWLGGTPVADHEGGWQTVGPSDVEFPGYPAPNSLTREKIAEVVASFARSARLAREAGFDVVEVHAAHGYLLHSFLSPVSNTRDDHYGGSLENRARLVLEVIDAVRKEWPQDNPVFLRVSTTDWITESAQDDREAWTLEDTIQLAQWARERGIDLLDASSGGLVPVDIPETRDYQVTKAAAVRREVGLPVAAVGRISDPGWADELVRDSVVDAVFIGRALLKDASWANNAAEKLGQKPRFVAQYDYAL